MQQRSSQLLFHRHHCFSGRQERGFLEDEGQASSAECIGNRVRGDKQQLRKAGDMDIVQMKRQTIPKMLFLGENTSGDVLCHRAARKAAEGGAALTRLSPSNGSARAQLRHLKHSTLQHGWKPQPSGDSMRGATAEFASRRFCTIPAQLLWVPVSAR